MAKCDPVNVQELSSTTYGVFSLFFFFFFDLTQTQEGVWPYRHS